MSKWSLTEVLAGLHNDIARRLTTARETIGHPGTKGDASEHVWLQLLQTYLPKRYLAENAHVVDSNGEFSQQIDVLVFDRQYSPFIFKYEEQLLIPAESVYAAFEAKQSINANEIAYAQEKVASVRRLHRTSLPIPSANGLLPPKIPPHIIGGILTLDSDWKPPLGDSLLKSLANSPDNRLDLSCVAAHGIFACDEAGCHSTTPLRRAATAFLMELIARLQSSATVPMIDIRAYARWLQT